MTDWWVFIIIWVSVAISLWCFGRVLIIVIQKGLEPLVDRLDEILDILDDEGDGEVK